MTDKTIEPNCLRCAKPQQTAEDWRQRFRLLNNSVCQNWLGRSIPYPCKLASGEMENFIAAEIVKAELRVRASMQAEIDTLKNHIAQIEGN